MDTWIIGILKLLRHEDAVVRCSHFLYLFDGAGETILAGCQYKLGPESGYKLFTPV